MFRLILLFFFLLCSPVFSAPSNPFNLNSNDSVLHPDTIYFSDGKDGYKYWMVYTPYPNDADEKYFIERSNDCETWVQTGISPEPVLDSNEDFGWVFDSDPDMLYVSEYDKWFMVMAPRISGGSGSGPNERNEVLAFAYSANGKSWVWYDGISISGNTSPIIISGLDTGGQSWERSDATHAHTQYPTMIFRDGWFYLWYGETTGNKDDDCGVTNQVGRIGMAKFQWDDDNNDIINFSRYSGNPVIDIAGDETWCGGMGHVDVTIDNDGKFHLLCVRKMVSSGVEKGWYYTSWNGITWASGQLLIDVGAGDSWDDYGIYRSCFLHDGRGRQVLLNGRAQLFYSGWSDSNHSGIGIYDIGNFSTVFSKWNQQVGTKIIGTVK